MFSSGPFCTTMKSLFSKGFKHGTSSSNSSDSLAYITASSTTSTSSSPLSPLNPITSHCPLRHIPAVTDFGLVVSRTPVPALPPISQKQWLTGMTSSSNSLMASRPSTTPCNNISLHRQEEGPLVLRKLSQRPVKTGSPQVLLGGPGGQGTRVEVSPDTSRA